MQIISPDFTNGGNIPKVFTCDGEEVSPELDLSGIPESTRSLALVLDDPDAPGGTFTHWVVWNIPPEAEKIMRGTLPAGAVEGANSTGSTTYVGPCPPKGTHNYVFTLYALDTILEGLVPKSTDEKALLEKMTGHILASAELVGLYCRHE